MVSQESVTRLARQIFERVMAAHSSGENSHLPRIEHTREFAFVARQSLAAARIFEEEALKALEAARPAEAARRAERQAQKLAERRPPHAAPPRGPVGIF